MPDPDGFQERLENAIEAKRRFIEERQLPRLQTAFRVFQSLFENLHNVLLRKSLVQEDPYKYDHKFSEVSAPPREPFPESERRERLSQRLSEFHSQLEFLNTTYQFSLDFLTLERLKRIVGLVQYIRWQNLAPTSPDPTTAVLADALSRVRLGNDKVSIGILNTSISQVPLTLRELAGLLRHVVDFQREAYKLRLRRELLPLAASVLPRAYPAAPDKTLELLRGLAAQRLKGLAFYRELVRELLQEEFGTESETRRREALARLAIPDEQAERPPSAPDFRAPDFRAPDFRAVLRDGLRHMLAAGRHLAAAAGKLQENLDVLEGRKQGLGERLRAWWRRTRGMVSEDRVVEVGYFDSTAGSPATERIDLTRFLQQLGKRAESYGALASAAHPSSRRLESASEAALFEFLSSNLRELQLLHRRLEGLDEYFKSQASPQERPRMKGIRIEASAVKNAVVAANKRRYEYVARRDEQEQLEALRRGSSGSPRERPRERPKAQTV